MQRWDGEPNDGIALMWAIDLRAQSAAPLDAMAPAVPKLSPSRCIPGRGPAPLLKAPPPPGRRSCQRDGGIMVLPLPCDDADLAT